MLESKVRELNNTKEFILSYILDSQIFKDKLETLAVGETKLSIEIPVPHFEFTLDAYEFLDMAFINTKIYLSKDGGDTIAYTLLYDIKNDIITFHFIKDDGITAVIRSKNYDTMFREFIGEWSKAISNTLCELETVTYWWTSIDNLTITKDDSRLMLERLCVNDVRYIPSKLSLSLYEYIVLVFMNKIMLDIDHSKIDDIINHISLPLCDGMMHYFNTTSEVLENKDDELERFLEDMLLVVSIADTENNKTDYLIYELVIGNVDDNRVLHLTEATLSSDVETSLLLRGNGVIIAKTNINSGIELRLSTRRNLYIDG